ncbi:MAG: hypothetical protein JEY96_01460 [Bacteroidales bacterium]|nr:hypothetical protein [Bacteroidales bacterium]
MSEQVYITLLSTSGAIIIFLIGALGYFLKQIISIVKNLGDVLQAFREDYSATKERVKQMQLGCKERHDSINSKLTEHSKILDSHKTKIERLEVIVNP